MVKTAPQPLSNLQVELLQLYSTGISDEHLLEIKELLSKFLFEKAVNRADEIWDKRGYDENTINKWLSED